MVYGGGAAKYIGAVEDGNLHKDRNLAAQANLFKKFDMIYSLKDVAAGKPLPTLLAGDIVVFEKSKSGYGHVCVATGKVNGGRFNAIEQIGGTSVRDENGKVISPDDPAILSAKSMSRISRVLRAKELQQLDFQQDQPTGLVESQTVDKPSKRSVNVVAVSAPPQQPIKPIKEWTDNRPEPTKQQSSPAWVNQANKLLANQRVKKTVRQLADEGVDVVTARFTQSKSFDIGQRNGKITGVTTIITYIATYLTNDIFKFPHIHDIFDKDPEPINKFVTVLLTTFFGIIVTKVSAYAYKHHKDGLVSYWIANFFASNERGKYTGNHIKFD